MKATVSSASRKVCTVTGPPAITVGTTCSCGVPGSSTRKLPAGEVNCCQPPFAVVGVGEGATISAVGSGDVGCSVGSIVAVGASNGGCMTSAGGTVGGGGSVGGASPQPTTH